MKKIIQILLISFIVVLAFLQSSSNFSPRNIARLTIFIIITRQLFAYNVAQHRPYGLSKSHILLRK